MAKTNKKIVRLPTFVNVIPIITFMYETSILNKSGNDQMYFFCVGAEIIVCTPGRMIDMLAANSGKVFLFFVFFCTVFLLSR